MVGVLSWAWAELVADASERAEEMMIRRDNSKKTNNKACHELMFPVREAGGTHRRSHALEQAICGAFALVYRVQVLCSGPTAQHGL